MRILDTKIRIRLHFGTLCTIFFLAVYSKMVCPFINSLSIVELGSNLVMIGIFQVLLKEILFRQVLEPRKTINLPRYGYYIGVIVWVIAGIVGSSLHAIRYPDFPVASHLKLLSGYWLLGAGILAQWEYVVLERATRVHTSLLEDRQHFPEHVTRRVMEGYFLFTLVPLAAILVLVIRYVNEGLLRRDVAFEVAYLGVFYVVIALIVAVQFGRNLREDARTIVDGIHRIGEGQFDVALDTTRPDELGEVANGINQMALGLQLRERIKEAFGRFVSPNVAEEFIARFVQHDKEAMLGGQRRDVVVLMCDIRNFTPLSESMPPEALTELLNSYFSEMVIAIHSYDGMVDKFIGDAVMAVFGLVNNHHNAALDAVRAAQEMQQRLKEFNTRQSLSHKPIIQNGIGIHAGDAVAGYIGSVDRLEFTVIGTTVNIAARIESHSKAPNPQILFSPEIAKRIKNDIPVVSIGKASLKGVSRDLELFSLQELVHADSTITTGSDL